jgi:dienelactone hydrolase
MSFFSGTSFLLKNTILHVCLPGQRHHLSWLIMTDTSTSLSLSPSIVHQRLVRENKPSLSYQGGDVKAWQDKARHKLIELMGYDQLPVDKTPRNVRTLWRREHELGRIEKIVFTSEPGSDVPCYVCVPHAAAKGPAPAFVCLQGHSTGMHNSIAVNREDETTPIQVAGDRDFALGCMKRGLMAICVEQRSLGTRGENLQEKKATSGCHDAVMHALMLGRTVAAERVHDVACALTYLKSRPEADATRLGVMGNSGGGTITLFSAILPEISLAMPSCAFSTYAGSIMSIYHCGDNYIPRILQFMESADVAGLYAPRPLVIVAGKDDEIFPVDSVREAFAGVQRIYDAAGASDKVKLVIGSEGHRFYAEQGWNAMLPYL